MRTFLSDCIRDSRRLRSKVFIFKCREDFTAVIFRRAIICPDETREIEFAGGEMPFSKTELPGSIILELLDVPKRQLSYVDPPSGRWVIVDLTGVPYLTLWSDGGPFLCIEPCWGLTDHHQQRAFENKEGIQTIAPGGVLACVVQHGPGTCLLRLAR